MLIVAWLMMGAVTPETHKQKVGKRWIITRSRTARLWARLRNEISQNYRKSSIFASSLGVRWVRLKTCTSARGKKAEEEKAKAVKDATEAAVGKIIDALKAMGLSEEAVKAIVAKAN